jgi:poly(hydroxyalkanoate) depolymerase family esterase
VTYVHLGRRGLALACALLVGAGVLVTAAAPAARATASPITGSYANAAGSLAYELYVPDSYQAGTAVPLVVALHGCGETADQFRQLSGFDDLAAAKGFIVVYPEQSKSNNWLGCWDWFNAQQVTRGASEPSLIAGITGWVQQNYSIDPHRIYVTGLSAGGAMAAVMATTYPDLYAAVAMGSGCEYTAGAACAGWRSDDPELAGRRAYQAMGAYARPVPFMVFHGDQDPIVPPANAQQSVRAWQVADDWADDGAENGSIPSWPAKTRFGVAAGGQWYTIQYYSDGHGHELGQSWMVHGMGHAWSGGNAGEQFADPAGPSESAAMYDFFMSHPFGAVGRYISCPPLMAQTCPVMYEEASALRK